MSAIGERHLLRHAHRDEPAGERSLGRADPAGHGDEAGERRGDDVDEDELREAEVDAVAAADGGEREREEQLGAERAAEELGRASWPSRATAHELLIAARISGTTLCRSFGTASTATTATIRIAKITAMNVPDGSAPEICLVSSLKRTNGSSRDEHDLDDRVGEAVDRARGDGLTGRRAEPLQEPDAERDASRRSRHGQVEELDRGLEHDAGQQRQRVSAPPRAGRPPAGDS